MRGEPASAQCDPACGGEVGLMPRMIVPLLLLLAVVVSGVTTVYMKHRTRSQFIELQALQRDYDEMQINWGRLQLEASTWAAHDRVRNSASEQLNLYMPPGDAVVVVRAP